MAEGVDRGDDSTPRSTAPSPDAHQHLGAFDVRVPGPAAWRPVVLPPAPPASSEAVRRVLQRNGRRDTAPEVALRKELHALGLRFLVDASPAGTSRRRRSDIVLRGGRVAINVHGCFWHRCPEHFHAPKANAEWWRAKFDSIVARDADTEVQLLAAGWLPVVVWEHEDMAEAARRIAGLHAARRPGGAFA